ncbi:hypothetical protein P4C99_18625 [Pontiellaceae bacterium B1224]|nr:hypothetical protein [Pontiellaceae bacterium B1224]
MKICKTRFLHCHYSAAWCSDPARLVVSAEVRSGKDKTYYPAPAIPIKVIRKK